MAKYQYFGPPFSIQLSGRTLQLRPGSVVQLDESEAEVVRSYNDLRLTPVPEPKITPSSLVAEKEAVDDESVTTDSEGAVIGSGIEEPSSEVEEGKQDESEKKKKKKKRERKKYAPDPDNEG